jgi:membrane protein DedA with SNARE-associated domain/pimeloyl-ACP methyl ester carboxylesterase
MRRLVLLFAYVLVLVASHLVRRHPGDLHAPEPATAYREFGDGAGDGESGPSGRRAVVLLDDLAASGGALSPLPIDEGPGRRQVVAERLAVRGNSGRAGGRSFEARARALLDDLDGLGLERMHLVATGTEGGTALHLAALAPDRIASIALVSAIGVQELDLLGDPALDRTVYGLWYAALRLVQEATPHFGLLDRHPFDAGRARDALEADMRPLRGLLRTLEMPVLVVHGESDFSVSASVARETARIVPQARLVLVEGGHRIARHRTARVAGALNEFLQDVEDGRAERRADADATRRAAAEEPFDWRLHGGRGATWELAGATLLGVATLASEDLACIWGGLLAGRGALGFLPAVLGCLVGIVVGDGLLFLAGRWLGARALRRRPWRWFLDTRRVERCEALFRRRGASLVLLARFTPGLRLPTYFAAGAVGMPAGRFLLYFLGAAILWTPLLVSVAMVVGEPLLRFVERSGRHAWWVAPTVLFGAWLAVRVGVQASTWRGRRLMLGKWRRTVRWEFWPAWAVYPPIGCKILWLGLRHRCPTLFAAVNPGMPCSGLAGESKSAILASFVDGGGMVARFTVLDPDGEVGPRLARLAIFMEREGLEYPVVLKPDVGERGQGVAVVRDRLAAASYLGQARGRVIAQEYVGGREFGLFYVRHPRESRGRLVSVTAKHLLHVRGDGLSTLEELVLADDRAVCMAPFFLEKLASRLGEVPGEGAVVRLGELGTHCRGAVFLDGRDEVWSEVLEERVDALSRSYEGFFFGRYDVRTPSAEALRERGEFKVLELNGVTSEPTHIYDPRYSIVYAWRTLGGLWRTAFEIGAAHRAAGVRVPGLRDIVRALRAHAAREKYEA